MKNLVIACIVCLYGCSVGIKLPGTQDRFVETVRLMSEAQTASVRAMAEVMKLAQATECKVPEIR